MPDVEGEILVSIWFFRKVIFDIGSSEVLIKLKIKPTHRIHFEALILQRYFINDTLGILDGFKIKVKHTSLGDWFSSHLHIFIRIHFGYFEVRLSHIGWLC